MWAKVRKYLAWFAAAIVALFALLLGLCRREDTRIREDLARRQGETSDVGDVVARAKAEVAESQNVLAEEKAKRKQRQKTAEDLERRLRDLAHVIILLVLSLPLLALLGYPVLAAEPALPSDYDTLARYYKEALNVAEQYKALYEDAEASNARLMAEVEALQARITELTALVEKLRKLVDEQQAAIMRLLTRKPLGVVAGLTVSGLAPPTPGLMVGVTVGF